MSAKTGKHFDDVLTATGMGHLLNKTSAKTGKHVDDLFMAIGRVTPL